MSVNRSVSQNGRVSESECEIVWGLRGRKMIVFLFNVPEEEIEREGEDTFFLFTISTDYLFFYYFYSIFNLNPTTQGQSLQNTGDFIHCMVVEALTKNHHYKNYYLQWQKIGF